jgi:hypothetical protein
MIAPATTERGQARSAVLEGLARLRAAFPLEARLQNAGRPLRLDYGRVLAHWLRAAPPPLSLLDATTLSALQDVDAVVPDAGQLGCYPFSARPTGITVTWPAGTVQAMCAIDALAVARLARARTAIASTCVACGTGITCTVEDDGSLEHDQADRARVLWQTTCHDPGPCSTSLCRNIRFLCNDCVPAAGPSYTLPQAAAIGNAFFAFQQLLLADAGEPR